MRLFGDLVIAAFFEGERPKDKEGKRAGYVSAVVSGKAEEHRDRLEEWRHAERPLVPFHWEIEFPEVFERENPGFDAIVGNPPFMGGSMISTALSKSYLAYLKTAFHGCGGRTDLVVYFFRRAYETIRSAGILGLIATKTVAQGDSRRGGLTVLLESGGRIIAADRRIRWSGAAAVTVSIIHVIKGEFQGMPRLDGSAVESINAFLLPSGIFSEPRPLSENSGLVFTGVMPYGQGFFFEDGNERATPLAVLRALTATDPHNGEVVFPFVGGDEILSEPRPSTSRVIV